MAPQDDKYTGNRSSHWFAQKRYGIGATPVTPQGWLVTIGFVIAVIAITQLQLGVMREFVAILAISVIFIRIVHAKTQGGFTWRWGKRGD